MPGPSEVYAELVLAIRAVDALNRLERERLRELIATTNFNVLPTIARPILGQVSHWSKVFWDQEPH